MQDALPGGNSALRDRMTARLRHAGLRPTRQRVELGCILFAKGHRHITAEDLHAEADVAGFRVSLATVYNTLHQLTESGLLRAVAIDGSPTYFDTNASDHHHFFVEGEGQLIDLVGDVGIDRLPEPPEGMEVTAVELVVRVRRRRRGFTARRPPASPLSASAYADAFFAATGAQDHAWRHAGLLQRLLGY